MAAHELVTFDEALEANEAEVDVYASGHQNIALYAGDPNSYNPNIILQRDAESGLMVATKYNGKDLDEEDLDELAGWTEQTRRVAIDPEKVDGGLLLGPSMIGRTLFRRMEPGIELDMEGRYGSIEAGLPHPASANLTTTRLIMPNAPYKGLGRLSIVGGSSPGRS